MTRFWLSVLVSLPFTAPAFAQAPFPLVQPLAGTNNVDWTIVNYVDLDGTNGIRDYNGGSFTYNGHDALDITLPNFAAMERGVPVYAAAAGTVSFVEDRNFDRCSRDEPCNGNPNWIRITHSNGFETFYYHIARNSAAVTNGQTVTAGQQIALVGSAGFSSDAHLHFTVEENGATVETYQNPSRFWSNPLPYAGNGVRVIDSGITKVDPSLHELVDRPSDNDVFYIADGAGQQARFWVQIHSLANTDTVTYRLFRPNGTQWANFNLAAATVNWGWQEVFYNLPAVPDAGLWTAAVLVNNTQVHVKQFLVVGSAQTNDWAAPGSFISYWNTPANWTGNNVPTAGNFARITATDGAERNVYYDVNGPTLRSLVLDLTGPGTNHISFNNMGRDMKLIDGAIIGEFGRATFYHSGGRITSADQNLDWSIGRHPGSDGVYEMGFNASLHVARDLFIGAIGNARGTFNHNGGTTTTGSDVHVGNGVGSTGTYNLTGGTLNLGEGLYAGIFGNGTVNVSGRSQVLLRDGATLGYYPGSNGTVVFHGNRAFGDTVPGATGKIVVAREGSGTLHVRNGATLSNVSSTLAERNTPSASGNAHVNTNGVWRMSGDLIVGEAGVGNMTIATGGVVRATSAIVGLFAGSTGTVTITGDFGGSRLEMSNYLHIGSVGTGSVVVSNSGSLRADGEILVNRFAAGNGTLRVQNHSNVTTFGELRIADEGTGVVQIEGTSTVYAGSSIYLGRNAVSANARAIVTGIESELTSDRQIVVGGAGNGHLTVSHGAYASALQGVTIGTRGTLDGNAFVGQNVTSSGNVNPGLPDDPGVLQILGSYTQLAAGKLNINLASGTDYSRLTASNSMNLGGILNVTALGFMPIVGQSFDILNWITSRTGTFTTVNLPALAAGMSWDTSQLYTTGVISVLGANGLVGDFNQSGTVDASDYVGWRNAGGSAAAYSQWRANFGRTTGSGANTLQAPIPEPTSGMILATALVGALAVGRATRQNRPHARRILLRSVC